MKGEPCDNDESSLDQKKNRLTNENKSESFFNRSILIMMISFGLVFLFEFIRLLVDFSIFIRELINPPGWYAPFIVLYNYLSFYDLIPFLGFILIFFGMIKTYDSINEELKPRWLLISRLFLVSGLILLFLVILQIIERFVGRQIGFKVFTVGLFNHKKYAVFDMSVVIYAIGFALFYCGVSILRKDFLINNVKNQKKKKSISIIFAVILTIEIIHLLSIMILDILGYYFGIFYSKTEYFLCSVILTLTPLVYTLFFGYLYKNLDLVAG